MIFEDFVTQDLLNQSRSLLGSDIVVTRLNSLQMPPTTCFKILDKLVVNSVPMASNVGSRNKDYKINYQNLYCELTSCPRIKFVLYTTYSVEFGEICILISKRGEVFRTQRAFIKASRVNKEEVLKPIMDEILLNEIVRNTITFVKHCQKLKLKLDRGLLLHGAVGNGKSLLCNYLRQLCQQAKLEFATIKQGKAISTDLEHQFKDITVFDDFSVDLLGKDRRGGAAACDLLSVMSGANKNHKSRAVVFTTNEEINNLDPAFLRAGRLSVIREIKPPTAELRRRLVLERWPENIVNQIKKEDSLDFFVENTDGFSFAETDDVRTIILVNQFDGKHLTLREALEEYYLNKEQKPVFKEKKVGFQVKT